MKNDFQSKMDKLESNRQQMTVRYLYSSMSSFYDHYLAATKRMENLKGNKENSKNFHN